MSLGDTVGVSLRGFNRWRFSGSCNKKLYIDQKAILVLHESNNCARKSTNIGFTFANKSQFYGTTDYVGISNSNLINLKQLITAR
jgi:hypothetical protein